MRWSVGSGCKPVSMPRSVQYGLAAGVDSHLPIGPFAIGSSTEVSGVEMRSHPGIQSEHDLEFLIHPADDSSGETSSLDRASAMTMCAIQFGAIMTKRDFVGIADSLLPDLTNGPDDSSPFLDYGEASDEQLLAAARTSDERAFSELSG